ncbi:MAG: hypothetical protein KC729_04995 [Candidatus Eisenbacteria bacterium]|uniref:Uncharacterized protein n=1 Tax=Eiseniibacteriota bacterium TaxID=2212470 RepID=A0A956RPQ9_UNCEI|nr:hypothetical protein [Candidatus Eisenbacteria bacterium]
MIGSTSFWGADSEAICASGGARLASLDGLVLLTGGVTGVGETVGRSFFDERRRMSRPTDVYHILPEESWNWDYGTTLFAGADMAERREILGRLTGTYLAIEGGPGTAHEAAVARSNGAIVVPVGRTGGVSRDLYASAPRPASVPERDWELLGDSDRSIDLVSEALGTIMNVLTRGEGSC